MKKILVKDSKRRIKGFVGVRGDGQHYYAFGRPSQNSYIAFDCNSVEQGIARIEMHTNNGNV
jgi:hypothetical protein